MRMLSGVEAPDTGTRREGHQVVMQYFAQDEATRLNPALSVYETMSADSPTSMVPAIRNILGGFLFSGDDVYKKAGVLSGGERTRLAVARMLLIPSNTLLLDEPTNHLDLDSKDILLEALEDYGGTLIFVSHDRYFVEKLATKIVEIGHGEALVFPGTYTEFLWSKEQRAGSTGASGAKGTTGARIVAPEHQSCKGGCTTGSAGLQPCQLQPLPSACQEPSRRPRRSASARRRNSASAIRPRKKSRPDLRPRGPNRRARTGDEGDRSGDVGPRFLRQSRPGAASHRPPPGPDVGARRADAPMGEETGRSQLQSCPPTDDNVISRSQFARESLSFKGLGAFRMRAAGHGVCPYGTLTGPWRARIPLLCRS